MKCKHVQFINSRTFDHSDFIERRESQNWSQKLPDSSWSLQRLEEKFIEIAVKRHIMIFMFLM